MFATNDENIKKYCKLLEADRSQTFDEVAHEFDKPLAGILHSDGTFANEEDRCWWVPHTLSETVKIPTSEYSEYSLLQSYHEEGYEMLRRSVAIDETWMRSVKPELRIQSSEWHTKNSPRLVKLRRSQYCAKTMMIFRTITVAY